MILTRIGINTCFFHFIPSLSLSGHHQSSSHMPQSLQFQWRIDDDHWYNKKKLMMQAMTVSTVWGRRFAFSAPFIIRMCCLMLRWDIALIASGEGSIFGVSDNIILEATFPFCINTLTPVPPVSQSQVLISSFQTKFFWRRRPKHHPLCHSSGDCQSCFRGQNFAESNKNKPIVALVLIRDLEFIESSHFVWEKIFKKLVWLKCSKFKCLPPIFVHVLLPKEGPKSWTQLLKFSKSLAVQQKMFIWFDLFYNLVFTCWQM